MPSQGWATIMTLDRRFFEEMPKAEVHVHIDGAIRKEDIWRISQQQGIVLPELPEQTEAALDAYYRLPPDASFKRSEDFNRFLKMFEIVLSIMQTPDGLRETARSHVQDLARQKHIYAETRFAPQYHQRNGLSLKQVIEHVLEGLHRGFLETGTLVKLIICIGREEVRPEVFLAITKAAIAFKDAGVVGLDLACNEVDYPPQLHIPAYQLAYGAQLHRTVHAGELAKSEEERVANIVTALDDLKADGLGHAVPLVRHPSLLERVIRDRVRIESCPFSNRITGAIQNGNLRELGLDQLLRKGALVSLNTDDPLIFGTSLADVFQATCEAYDFEVKDVRRFMRNAVESAFCNDDERARVYYQFKHRGFPLY